MCDCVGNCAIDACPSEAVAQALAEFKASNCSQPDEETRCSEDCAYSDDGDCNDGGLGATYDECLWGTDCKDCAERSRPVKRATRCSDTCKYSQDGGCDDGGLGSLYDVCTWGADCEDCGERRLDISWSKGVSGNGFVALSQVHGCHSFCEMHLVQVVGFL